ncbi:MAG: methyltransferase domain-containing protein [Pseudomonadota bacterium]|nr:methyltransferase domain-containing protein [Pseudomonadota bacterium]
MRISRLYRKPLCNHVKHSAAAKEGAATLFESSASEYQLNGRNITTNIEIESINSVAETALENGSYGIALDFYGKVLDLAPEYHDALWGLAEASYGIGDKSAALNWYQRYLDKHPEDPEAAHMVAALGDGPKPLRADDNYVRGTFNHFAEDFERQLLDDLEYQAPNLIYALFAGNGGDGKFNINILDVGCGTGLSGIDFKSHARRLTGVDLSPEMLKIAKKREIYDELLEDELSVCMRARPGTFDLIVAADVFCYIGDLSETLKAAWIALKPSGRLIFSVEAQSTRGFTLTDTGRYAHKPAYVQKVANSSGFYQIVGHTDRLRTEYGDPVKGYFTMLEK